MSNFENGGYFVENRGQWDGGSSFYGPYGNSGIAFFDDGIKMNIVTEFQDHEEPESMDIENEGTETDASISGFVLDMEFIRSNDLDPKGVDERLEVQNFLIGDSDDWVTGVNTYESLMMEDVWDGIGLRYYYNEDGLKYDFVVSPGADPTDILIRLTGQQSIDIDGNDLVIKFDDETEIRDTGLTVFYSDDPGFEIDCKYQLTNGDSYSFDLGTYDSTRTIIIDPLYYSTYLGGRGNDYGYDVAVDDDGNSYVTGYTYYSSGGPEFPTTSGAYQTSRTYTSYTDSFLTKFNYDGSEVYYSTFIGGYYYDYGYGVDVDSSGHAYITGYTRYHSSGNFPTTSGAYRDWDDTYKYSYNYEVYITKFSEDGSDLEWSTLLGGAYYDYVYDIVVDDDDNAIVSGRTYFYSYYASQYGDFPTTSGAFQTSRPGGTSSEYDGFVTMINDGGSSLGFSTFIGSGAYGDYAYAIALDGDGNTYVTGRTDYDSSYPFPTTSGAFKSSISGSYDDAFVVKLDSSGDADYSTLLGGGYYDYGYGIDVDSNGYAVVTGVTRYYSSYMSSYGYFPTTSGSYMPNRPDTSSSEYDIFVTKFNSGGTGLIFSTFLGGSYYEYMYEYGNSLAVGNNDDIYIFGTTRSTDFPTVNAYQSSITYSSYNEFFLTNMSSSGSSISYSTLFGGAYYDYSHGMDIDQFDNVYLCGRSYYSSYYSSSYGDFPTTSESYMPNRPYTGGYYYDAAVLKYGADIADNEKPYVVKDNSDPIAYSNNLFTFNPDVSDNVGLTELHVEYWFGSGSHTNTTFTLLEPYKVTITLPKSVDPMTFFYSGRDYAGNWFESEQFSRNLVDGTAPTYTYYDLDPDEPITGTQEFIIDWSDNVLVDNVTMKYRFDQNSAFTPVYDYTFASDEYTFEFDISSTNDEVYIISGAKDLAGNTMSTPVLFFEVNKPQFSNHNREPASLSTGSWVNISLDVTDNGVLDEETVTLHYNDDGAWHTMTMIQDTGDSFFANFTIDGSTTLYYYVTAVDDNDYTGQSQLWTVSITDDDLPTWTDNSPNSGTTGDSYTFDISASDNVEIDDVVVSWVHGTNSGTEYLSDDGDGTYSDTITLDDSVTDLTYSVTVTDTSLNSVSGSSTLVSVSDNDEPEYSNVNMDPDDPITGNLEVSIDWTDNVQLMGVTLYYRLDSTSSYTSTSSFTVSGSTHSYTITVPATTDDVYYYWTASDPGSNLVTTDTYYSRVNLPMIGTHSINPASPTTGEAVTVSVDASDNDQVSSVTLFYNDDGSWHQTPMSLSSGSTYTATIYPDGSLSMDYNVSVRDDNGYINDSSIWTVSLTDNDDPTYTDNSASTGTTGDSFTFDISASDNVEIATVDVTWSHGTLGGTVSLSDDGDGTYSASVSLDDSVSSMTYTVTVADTSLNSVSSPSATVTVSDNDAPEYSGISISPEKPITGSQKFMITWTDNVQLNNPTLYYRLDSTSSYTALTTYTNSGDDYEYTVTITSSVDHLYYYFTATDPGSNLVTTPTDNVKVNLPQLGSPSMTPSSPTTGETVNITIDVTDNDQVDLVVIYYREDGGDWESMNMTYASGDEYFAVLDISEDAEDLDYYIEATDDNDFTNKTSSSNVVIVDNDDPTFTNNSPSSGTTGDSFIFDVSASDNVDIDDVEINWTHSGSWTVVSMTDDGDGTFSHTITLDHSLTSMTYDITVIDTSDNTVVSSTYTVTVSDNDYPEYSDITLSPEDPITGTQEITVTWEENIALSSLALNYRTDNTSAFTSLSTYTSSGDDYTFSFSIPSSSDHLYYNLSAVDSSGNTVVTPNYYEKVNLPQIGDVEVSPDTLTTGSWINITVDVTDNDQVNSVVLYYQVDGGVQTMDMTKASGNEYFANFTIDGALVIYYAVWVMDDNGFENNTATFSDTITDNDDPTFTDSSATTGTTGDAFIFDVAASDNIEIDYVEVIWSHNSTGGTITLTDDNDGTYSKTVYLDNSLSSMSYTVNVYDTSGNSVSSSTTLVTVTDNDDPVYSGDTIDPEEVITGDLELSITWKDNIELKDITLFYKLDSDVDYTSMTTYTRSGDMFIYDLTIPSGTFKLMYYHFGNDTTGHEVTTSIVTKMVNQPRFANHAYSPSTLTTGESINITIDVTDDSSLSSVVLYYNDDGSWHTMLMSDGSGDEYFAEFNIDASSTGISYYIRATDDEGNYNDTQTWGWSVIDNDAPTYTDNSPTGTTGDTYSFDLTASDNIGIDYIQITWSHGLLTDTTTFSDDGDGTWSLGIILDHDVSSISYSILVMDVNGLSVSFSSTKSVSDNDDPTFTNSGIVPATPSTGEYLNIIVDVSDNIGYQGSSVMFYYRDTTDSTFYSISMANIVGDTYYVDIIVPNYFSWMYYYFEATDLSSNVGTSTIHNVEVYDDEAPTFVRDDTGDPTTGDSFTFELVLNDNVGIDYGYVEYWYGASGSHTRLSFSIAGQGLGSDQTCTLTITVPLESIETLYYFYHFRDDEGNWWESGPSSTFSRIVEDNDVPFVVSDQSDTNGFTSDPYRFVIEIDDNIDGANVVEAYVNSSYGWDWTSFINHTLTYNATSGYWESQYFTLMDTLSPLTYFINAKDIAGNWMEETGYSTPMFDNDIPTYTWPDSSQAGVTTGDAFNFTVAVQDNIAVDHVDVNIEFQGFMEYPPIRLTEISPGIYSVIFMAPHSIGRMTYDYTLVDTSGNTETTMSDFRDPVDNDYPIIFSDMSQLKGIAGYEYYFKTQSTDNIDLIIVELEYKYSWTSSPVKVEMQNYGQDIFQYKLDLPIQAGTMEYRFISTDHMDFVTMTEWKQVEIVDNLPPVLSNIDIPENGTTGDEIVVSINVIDDLEIKNVLLWYKFGSSNPIFTEGDVTGDTYTFTVLAPHEITTFTCWFEAWDTVRNTEISNATTINILDNDLPEFQEDMSSTEGTTGDVVVFNINATDNIIIESFFLEYSYNGTYWESVDIATNDNNYYYELTIPIDFIGLLDYRFTAYDGSGNMKTTETTSISITDDESPVAVISGPDEVDQFEEITFTAMYSSDNIGIIEYGWEVDGEQFSGMHVNYTFNIVGVYIITLTVYDGVNPSISMQKNLTVLDAEAPVIDINWPDSIGNHETLILNASASIDNVAITVFNWLIILPDNTRVTGNEDVFSMDMEGINGNITVYLTVSDARGNTAKLQFDIRVLDLLPPIVIVPEDITELEGAFLTFDAKDCYDNIGITKWLWIIQYQGGEEEFNGNNMNYFFENPGVYNITLVCYDSSNNSASDFFLVNILEKGEDFDSDGDGIPDSWEEEMGLDPDLDDSNRDYDGDLLTNIKEYELQTNPKDSDTDGDGMNDKYEYDHAFHEGRTDLVDGIPRWMVEFEPENDEDGDGDTNIEESRYTYRDPTVPDAPEEAEDESGTYILFAILLIIITLILVVGAIIFIGRGSKVEEDFPKNEYPHLYEKK